jgi:hypothetical protein
MIIKILIVLKINVCMYSILTSHLIMFGMTALTERQLTKQYKSLCVFCLYVFVLFLSLLVLTL